MNLLSLPVEVQQLARLGGPGYMEDLPWADYRSLGILTEHIPALISIIENIEDFPLCDEVDPCDWLPLHAWRALAQLQAQPALPALIELLKVIDEEDDEIVQDDLPVALSRMCPEAIPLLIDYIKNPTNGVWARLGAAEALQIAATEQPGLRNEIVSFLASLLDGSPGGDTIFNSVLVDLLMKLKAVEASPQVEVVFNAGKIDESICGDWEDFQVEAGLLTERLSAPAHRFASPASFVESVAPHSISIQETGASTKTRNNTRKKRKKLLAPEIGQKKKK